jgi:hypothetical protein
MVSGPELKLAEPLLDSNNDAKLTVLAQLPLYPTQLRLPHCRQVGVFVTDRRRLVGNNSRFALNTTAPRRTSLSLSLSCLVHVIAGAITWV